MNKDFELFKDCFEEYKRRFGLIGYKTYFKHEPLEKSFADININHSEMVATVRLNSELLDKDKPFKNVKRSAKHEAIHLLVGRLEQNAHYRYSSEAEIYEATEELVFKLEELING